MRPSPHSSHSRPRRRNALPLVVALLAAGLSGGRAQAGEPGACGRSNLRWASSSNTLYVSGAVICTLSDLDQHAAVPLSLVDARARIWLLRANIVLQDGATLRLRGSRAGGDVNQLRLRSNDSSANDAVVFVRAEWGTIEIEATRVTSWDEHERRPDTSVSDRRAYLHVRSLVDSDGTPRQSRMDILHSDVGYLGYSASESYGLVWKVSGTARERFDRADVFGDIIGSRIHHNYFGVYTYGAFGMRILDNEIDHNVQYGLDPHDDSDSLLIEGNHSHDNGNHGIICSQRCDHVVIRDNVSADNTGHGIMLHRSVTESVVEGNRADGNSDTGIALMEAHRNVVRDNIVVGNRRGIRISVGSADNLIEGNDVGGNSAYGFYGYRGSDEPTTGDGRPRRNRFVGNHVHGSGSYAVKFSDVDDSRFEANLFRANDAGIRLQRSDGTVFAGNDLRDAGLVTAYGSGRKTTTQLSGFDTAALRMDEDASFVVTDDRGAVFDLDESAATTSVSPGGSRLVAGYALTGGRTTAVTRGFAAAVTSGGATVSPETWQPTTRTWRTQAPTATQSVAYVMGELAPGGRYEVARDGVFLGLFTADAAGIVRFSDASRTTVSVAYALRPA